MSEYSALFSIPVDFVTSRVRLSPGELAHGYFRGWLDEAAAISIAEHLVATGTTPAPILELASVFRQEHWRVEQILGEIEDKEVSDQVWLYLALDWLHDHRYEHAEPLEIIAALYADFGYPKDIDSLVYYMPAPPGAPTGAGVLEEAWEEYLRQKRSEYANRRTSNDTGEA